MRRDIHGADITRRREFCTNNKTHYLGRNHIAHSHHNASNRRDHFHCNTQFQLTRKRSSFYVYISDERILQFFVSHLPDILLMLEWDEKFEMSIEIRV